MTVTALDRLPVDGSSICPTVSTSRTGSMHRPQFLGAAIRHLKRKALAGAAPDELEAFLTMRAGDNHWTTTRILGQVFRQGTRFTHAKRTDREQTNAAWAKLIAEHRNEWERAPVPELMRLRDYFSFMQFTQQEDVVVVVCAANPAAGTWVGNPGVRCYAGKLPILSRVSAPNEGLLAADPSDARLIAMLTKYEQPLSYAAYVERLNSEGLRVGAAEAGYVVTNATGQLLHEAYRLHGVYDATSDEPAWTPKRAEHLRRSLNRHLGAELLMAGPHDDWEFRNERNIAGPLFGPQLPVLIFGVNQEIHAEVTTGDLFPLHAYKIRWNDLYPHHPVEEK